MILAIPDILLGRIASEIVPKLKTGALALVTERAKKTPLQHLMGALGKALMAAGGAEGVSVTPFDATPA